MRMMCAIRCLLAVCTVLPYVVKAQSKLSINNVYSAKLRNSGPIIANNEVKGYFLFYQSDKIDRKTNEYTLQILDENVNKVKDIKFTDDKNTNLLEAAFNGTDIMFEFFNAKDKLLDFRVYGLDGKQKYSYSQELSKRTINYMQQKGDYSNDDAENNTLFGAEGKGFISLIPIRDGRQYTYQVSGYKTDKKGQWTFEPDEDNKFSSPLFLGSTDSIAVFEVIKKEGTFSGKIQSWLLGINLTNGKKTFEFETNSKDKYAFFPMNVTQLAGTGNFALSGPYFDADARVLKDKSQGMGIWVMDSKGKLLNSKYSSWEGDLAKYLPVNDKGKIDEVGYMYIHKVVQTSDGNIFAVAEGYKQQVSALGTGLKVLGAMAGGGGGVSAVKLKITDMVMLQYDSTFKLKNAKVYDKNNNNVEMPGGSEFMGPQTMALYASAIGAFDYSFTEKSSDMSTFEVGYTDYVREDGYKGGTFNTISYYNGKFTTDRINLKSAAKYVAVFPGKTGSVMIMEYYKKDKRLDVRLEKVN